MGPGDLSALSFAALPPPLAPKATGMPSPAPQLLPALVCLGNEGRLLARIMYKSKNQHRAAGYFHKLQQIARTLKNIMRIGLYLQSVCGEKVPASLACTAAEPMATHAASLARLCDKAQADCRAAYSYHRFCRARSPA